MKYRCRNIIKVWRSIKIRSWLRWCYLAFSTTQRPKAICGSFLSSKPPLVMLCQWQWWPWQPKPWREPCTLIHTSESKYELLHIWNRLVVFVIDPCCKAWLEESEGYLRVINAYLFSLPSVIVASVTPLLKTQGNILKRCVRVLHAGHSAWAFRWKVWESQGVLNECTNTLFMLLISGYSVKKYVFKGAIWRLLKIILFCVFGVMQCKHIIFHIQCIFDAP